MKRIRRQVSEAWVFYSVDYTGGELVTHAESCYRLVGYSKLGEALNAGVDVHGALGATMMGLSYEDFKARLGDKSHPDAKRCKSYRQAAKPPNFGFPGRMGEARLVLQAREDDKMNTPHPNGPALVWDGKDWVHGYKGTRFCVMIGGADACGVEKDTEWNKRPISPTCVRCLECAREMRQAWRKQWPENVRYLEHVVPEAEEQGYVVQHYSNRVRGTNDGGSIANGWFQAFLADIAGRALCRVTEEQYVRTVVHARGTRASRFEGMISPLFGSRGEVFAHDELFGEAPESIAAEVAERVTECMVEEFEAGCPNHIAACKAEPALARRWYKGMEPVRDANGRLLLWAPPEAKARAAA